MQEKTPERVRTYAAAHKKAKLRRTLVTVLSCAVALGTAYVLMRPAVTMEQATFCGMEEHIHTDACEVRTLICPLEESTEQEQVLVHMHDETCYGEDGALVCMLDEYEPVESGHTHTEACYETQLVCALEEHQHDLHCYADVDADLESAEIWEQSIPAPGENLGGSVVCVAESQLGYTASERNYIVDEQNAIHGYTRYGAWYGSPYEAWDALFVSFCLHYAGVPQSAAPCTASSSRMMMQLDAAGLFAAAEIAQPQPGDLVFCDRDVDGIADHVGIVQSVEGSTLCTIEGDVANCVTAVRREMADGVLGYGLISQADAPDGKPEMPVEEEAQEDTPQGEAEAEYVCGMEAHSHDDSCYDKHGELTCVLAEHVHTEACLAKAEEKMPTCGIQAHTHGESCYDENGTLVCELEEHTHTDVCYKSAEAQTKVFEYDDGELKLEITATGKPLDENAELSVQTVESAETYALSEEMQTPCELVREIGLTLDGEALTTDDLTLTGKITPSQALLDALFDQLATESQSKLTLRLMQPDEAGTPAELARATVLRDGEAPTFETALQGGTLILRADAAGEGHTVQWYAYVPRWLNTDTGKTSLTVIDTRENNLPRNGVTPATTELWLDENGYVATAETLTEIFESKDNQKLSDLLISELQTMNKNHYLLREIWVLMDGKSPDSTAESDWTIYKAFGESTVFTGNADAAENAIFVPDGAAIRFVYQPTTANANAYTAFYDYDITDGNGNSALAGINQKANYGAESMSDEAWVGTEGEYRTGILAFGNGSANTGLQNSTFDGVNLNVNGGGEAISECVFGIVTGLNGEHLQYAPGIQAPKLFSDGGANGKYFHDGNLTFQRVGDTYTLIAATAAGRTITDLARFTNPTGAIWTNSFWPLDGTTGHDPLFGSGGGVQVRGYNGRDGTLLQSDDGMDHNSFFGMEFEVDFAIPEGYAGPLDYTFFGDDDMWVFLDGRLVCDIGGVHSSVGEYVDLRNYLTDDGKEHNLKVFYTERGSAGSTCYISFTLPDAVPKHIEPPETGDLTIRKNVDGEVTEGTAFTFKATFEPAGTYAYTKGDETGTLSSGETFTLKDGETIRFVDLPAGTRYTIEEILDEAVKPALTTNSVNGIVSNSDLIANGMITSGIDEIVYTNYFWNKTPSVIRILKVDENNVPLTGAVFRLKCASENQRFTDLGNGKFEWTDKWYPIVSDLPVNYDGTLTLSNLPANKTFELCEVSAPDRCVILNGIVKFETDANGNIIFKTPIPNGVTIDDQNAIVKVTNAHKPISLTLTKVLQGGDANQKFEFEVSYVPASSGESITQTVKLKAGDESSLGSIPYGAVVTIKELNLEMYTLTFASSSECVTFTETTADSCTFVMRDDVVITATNTTGYVLPDTGGEMLWYVLAGLTLTAAGILQYIHLRRRRERGR